MRLLRLRVGVAALTALGLVAAGCAGGDEAPSPTATLGVTATASVRPVATSRPVATATPRAQAQSRLAFRFGAQVSAEDRALIQAGVDWTVDYLFEAVGVAPVRGALYAYQSPESLRAALYDDFEDQIFVEGAVQRLAVIPAETHPGLVLVSTGTREWRDRSAVARARVVAHEYFHLVQMQLLGRVARQITTTPVDQERPEGPTWLFEGSADYVSYRVLEAAGLSSLDAYLASAVVPRDIDITDLETFIEYYHAGEDRAVLPLLAVSLLVRDDVASLTRYYEAIGRGIAWRGAFAAAFGRSVTAFYAELRAEVARR